MKKTLSITFPILIVVTMTSCEFDVATETTVHPDGSLDKIITVEKTDSINYLFNVTTWDKSIIERERESTSVDSLQTLSKNEIDKFTSFHKKFSSAEEANTELSVLSDTLLQVTSRFEKQFRWFYTYITYSETYHKLNKLKLNPEDFFTHEDYAFIDRLPAEGQKISKADELYLKILHDKIFNEYGEKAIYDEWISLALIVVNTQPGIDSLKKHTNDFRNALEKIDESSIGEDKLLLATLDSFKIPIDQTKVMEFQKAQRKFWKKIAFISVTSDGKFTNRINMPWTLVNSNADSVAGNSLFWSPPSIKFLLKDYTMQAESRSLNWWAVIASAIVLGATVYVFIRKRN